MSLIRDENPVEAPTRAGRPRSRGLRLVMGFSSALLVTSLAAACLLPRRIEPVAPAISGRLASLDGLDRASEVVLVIRHRENPTLFSQRRAPLDAGGGFYFPPASLEIAGREYSKVYRAFLRVRSETLDRVVWRAEFSRRAADRAIELDCRLDRPIARGQPCQVEHPLRHAWLIEHGERTYHRLCATCHEPDATASDRSRERGGAPRSAPDLSRIAARRDGRFDRGEIAEWIEGRSTPRAHGESAMPVWGERLSAEYARFAEGDTLIGATLDPLLAYLESKQTD